MAGGWKCDTWRKILLNPNVYAINLPLITLNISLCNQNLPLKRDDENIVNILNPSHTSTLSLKEPFL
jgi:hypothetical protein